MGVDERTRRGFVEFIQEAYLISADVGAEVERALRIGREHPMEDEELDRVLTKVVVALKEGADRRGDAETARALQGDVSQIVRRIMRADGQVLVNGVSKGTRRSKLKLESYNGIDPHPVFPRPIYLGKEIAMNAGFLRTADIDLWDENQRIEVHLKQFEAKYGRRPSTDELFDIMTGKTKLEGVADNDQFQIDRLAASIAANGVRIPPILDVDGTLLDGNRRLTACYRVLESDEYDLQQKKRAERVFVWQLTEHRTEEDRDAVIVGSNFELETKQPWPIYVRARKVHEKFEDLKDLESMSSNPRGSTEIKKELSVMFGLGKSTGTVNRWLKMVEWSNQFEDYHINEKGRPTFEVLHRAEDAFEYFDELSKGQQPGGVAYALQNDDAFRRAAFDLLFQGTFKNWREVRELKHIHDNPEAREALIEAPKLDPDVARDRFEEAIATAKVQRAEKRTVGANTRIENFVTWLEELPLKAFRDDIKPRNLLLLRDALALAEKQVEAVIGSPEEEG